MADAGATFANCSYSEKHDPQFHLKILFSNEAHFWLWLNNVNKKNCHIWKDDNLQEIMETPLHPEKVNV